MTTFLRILTLHYCMRELEERGGERGEGSERSGKDKGRLQFWQFIPRR
jgi:hypothetical protein